MTTRATYDTRMAKALSHPTRVKAMEILSARVASPSDIAKELDLPVATVSYHVKTLLQLGSIEEVSTRHVRGSIEHFYRAIRRSMTLPKEFGSMPSAARQELVARVVENAYGAMRSSFEGGVIDAREDIHVSYTPLTLDEQAWVRLNAAMADVLTLAMDEHAASAARLAESGEPGIRTTLSMFQHIVPEPEATPGD